jgi:hypothetical protein
MNSTLANFMPIAGKARANCVQGIVFSKYVELDFDEVACKKVVAISSREKLRSVAEEGNPCDVDRKNGTLTSAQYCLLAADLRNLEQVRNIFQP